MNCQEMSDSCFGCGCPVNELYEISLLESPSEIKKKKNPFNTLALEKQTACQIQIFLGQSKLI